MSVALSKGMGKLLEPFFRKSIIDPFPAGGATLSRDYCDKNPTAARLIIDALDEAIRFIETKPQEAKLSLLNFTPLDEKLALQSQIYYWWGSSDISAKPIQRLADILTENGLLSNRIDVADLIR